MIVWCNDSYDSGNLPLDGRFQSLSNGTFGHVKSPDGNCEVNFLTAALKTVGISCRRSHSIVVCSIFLDMNS